MNVVGDASLWSDLFPDWLIPEILDLVISAWEAFDKPQPGDHEVAITMRFRSELVRHKLLRKLPLRIDREIPEDDLLVGQEKGRIDLRFIHGYQEGVYFAFECKRLNVLSKEGKRTPLAGEYVRAGMMRFITSQYAVGLDQGGMLGYVMDSDVKSSIRAVSQNRTYAGVSD